MSLFSSHKDRQHTQLAYKVRCFPWQELPTTGKELISWRRAFFLTKKQITHLLNEEMTKFEWKGKTYHIVWAFNNIPTEEEWEKKSKDFMIYIDLRFSPAIPELAVAIFDFQLPSSRKEIIEHGYMSSNNGINMPFTLKQQAC